MVVVMMGIKNGGEGRAKLTEFGQYRRSIGRIDNRSGVATGIVQKKNIVIGAGRQSMDVHKFLSLKGCSTIERTALASLAMLLVAFFTRFFVAFFRHGTVQAA